MNPADEPEALQAILQLPSAILVSRLSDGEIVWANEAAAAQMGLSVDQLIGQRTSLFYEDPGERERIVEHLRAEGHVRGHETWIETPRGRRRISLSLRVIRYGGQPCVLGSAVDVTRLWEVARSVQHRTKNNLQFVASLLYLHAREPDQRPASEVLDALRQRVLAIATVQDAIAWDTGEGDADPAKFLPRLAASVPGGPLPVAVPEGPLLALEQAIPLGLVAFELMSHGHDLALDRVGTTWRLRVTRRDEAALPPVTARLVRLLCDQLGGQLVEEAGAWSLAWPEPDG